MGFIISQQTVKQLTMPMIVCNLEFVFTFMLQTYIYIYIFHNFQVPFLKKINCATICMKPSALRRVVPIDSYGLRMNLDIYINGTLNDT